MHDDPGVCGKKQSSLGGHVWTVLFFCFFSLPGVIFKMVSDLFYSTLFLIIFFFVVVFFCTLGQTSFGLPCAMDVTCIWSCVLV